MRLKPQARGGRSEYRLHEPISTGKVLACGSMIPVEEPYRANVRRVEVAAANANAGYCRLAIGNAVAC